MERFFSNRVSGLILWVLALCCAPAGGMSEDSQSMPELPAKAASAKGWGSVATGVVTSRTAADTGTASASASVTTLSKPTRTPANAGVEPAQAAHVPQPQYDRILRREEFADLSKAQVLQLQRDMAQVFQFLPDWGRDFSQPKQPLDDGVVGPVTLFWLQRYCFHFKVAPQGHFARELPALVGRMAAFGKKSPGELKTLLSADFSFWDDAQGEPQRSNDFRVRAQGSDEELLALVQRYRLSRGKKNATTAGDNRENGTILFWALTPDDIQKIGGKDQIVEALATLKDKKFDSKPALKVAANAALGNRDDFDKALWPVISDQMVQNIGYQVSDASLAQLKAANFPEAVRTAVGQLKDGYYIDKAVFDASLADALKSVADVSADDLARITTAMEVNDSVTLDEQSLISLKKLLQNNIRNAGVPALVTKLLSELTDASYPELPLFQAAAQAKLMLGFGACRKNLSQSNPYYSQLRMSDDDITLLETQFTALANDGLKGAIDVKQVFVELRNLRARQTACGRSDLDKMNGALKNLYEQLLAPTVDGAAKKVKAYSNFPINWNGSGCGCALDTLSGPVVGFFPFWQNTDAKPQAMNFSVLTRVEYYGLTFDEWGELKQANYTTGNSAGLGSNESYFDFVRTARKFEAKVDWVVQRHDWRGEWAGYERERKAALLKKMADNVSAWLQTPLRDRFSRVKPYISLGTARQPRRGDGVTLYFPDYPGDKVSKEIFNEFFLYLKNKLANTGLWLNLAVAQHSMADTDGAFGLANLVSLEKSALQIDGVDSAGKPVINGYLMVMLEEPTSEAKKRLRLDIENESSLRGVDRAEFLRHLVTVLNFDNRNWQQLEDDIVYTQDNFGGVGFWPLPQTNLNLPLGAPTQSCAYAKQVALCLLQRYQAGDEKAVLPTELARKVCEYRWFLRITMDLFVLLDLALLLLFFRSCEAQNFMRSHFLWVLALAIIPPLVIFTLLLIYDPDLAKLSKGNMPFIIAVGVIIFGVIGGYWYLRSQREKPSRQRALPQRQKPGTRLQALSKPVTLAITDQSKSASAQAKPANVSASAPDPVADAPTPDDPMVAPANPPPGPKRGPQKKRKGLGFWS